jgi:plasmid stability protein
MTEANKKSVVIDESLHKKLKLRAVNNNSTIEKEIDTVLKEEFKEEGKVK